MSYRLFPNEGKVKLKVVFFSSLFLQLQLERTFSKNVTATVFIKLFKGRPPYN